jgi:exosortase
MSKDKHMRLSNLLYAAALAAHMPMFFGYTKIMWSKGHYQFFPLFILVIAWIIYDRLSRPSEKKSNRAGHLAAVILGLNLLLLLFATAAYSFSLTMPCAMLLSASFIINRYGLAGFRKAFPAWILMLLVLRLPWNIDLKLIQMMQLMASQLASWILDSLGQTHFREGVILITEQKQFFTEEACSGVRSLFSSVAAICAFGVARFYPFWRHCFNFLQTILWVIVGNAIRVALVVYISDNWTDAVATGTNHEMLGLAVFVLIFILALSTDRAIDALLAENPEEDIYEQPEVRGTVLNPTPPIAKANFGVFGWFFLVGFAAVIVLSVRINMVHRGQQTQAIFDEIELPTFELSDLPSTIEGWNVVNFEQSIRDYATLLAPNSQTWTLRKGPRELTVSLDSPYTEFHDLTFCYIGLGWHVQTSHQYSTKNPQEIANFYSTLGMSKTGQFGTVLFSAFGRDGKLTTPVTRSAATFRNFLSAIGISQPEQEIKSDRMALPVSQIQLLRQSPTEISESELEELTRLFITIRELIRKHSLYATANNN